jgi:tetratricopeptide (TPR) repeat protein
MREDNWDDTEIDRFITNQCDEEERNAFLKKMDGDVLLAREVTFRQQSIKAIKAFERNELKKRLQEHERQNYSAPTGTRAYYWVPMAASILLLLVFGIGYWLFRPANEWLQLDPTEYGIPNYMSNGQMVEFHNGMNAFKAGDYKKTIKVYEKMTANPNTSDTAWYYLGVAYFRLNQFHKAQNCFERLIESNSSFKSKSEYRLSLCYLHLGEFEQANVQIQQLRNDSAHVFFHEVRMLDSVLQLYLSP